MVASKQPPLCTSLKRVVEDEFEKVEKGISSHFAQGRAPQCGFTGGA